MKSNTKVILCLSGIAALVFCCFFAWYSYIVVSRDSEGGREGSSDDRTADASQTQEKPEDSAGDLRGGVDHGKGGDTADDFDEEYLGYLAQQFSYAHNRITEFEKVEDENGEISCLPIVGFHGRQPGEVESFSSACCDLVEELQELTGFEKIGYFSGEERRYFDITPYLEQYDRTEFYNAVYCRVEQDSLEVWQYDEVPSALSTDEETEEMPAVWAGYEAECSYQKKDGRQLCMVGVDRAAGSSYYVLLEAVDGVNVSVVNKDPYLGHGGEAKWIDFLEDEKTGFSCLAYSGGSLGSLYRTEDGGRSFQPVTYPSAQIKLPDGSLYNPFIMPEKIWEEDGAFYMLAGQGPDGDYYEGGERVYGLYESEDRGKNWRYVGTTAEMSLPVKVEEGKTP